MLEINIGIDMFVHPCDYCNEEGYTCAGYIEDFAIHESWVLRSKGYIHCLTFLAPLTVLHDVGLG